MALAACGFRPLYGGGEGALTGALGAVEVRPLEGDIGVEVYNHLADRLNPPDRGEKRAIYLLSVELQTASTREVISPDSRVRRFDLVATANYYLLESATSAVLEQGQTTVVTSYDVIVTASFATLSAERDARLRAGRELASSIVERIALFFDRRSRP